MFQDTDSSEASNTPDVQVFGAWRNTSPWLVDDDDDLRVDETERQLQFQTDIQDGFTANSPPLWKTLGTSADGVPLLSNGQTLGDLSPRSATRVIADGREEMMNMIRDLPESFYELSLKDIVDVEVSQEGKVDPQPIEEEPRLAARHGLEKQKIKSVKITRSDSMKTSSFLIKTCFPAFSISKRRFLVPENSSRISPRSSAIARPKRPEEKKNRTDRPVELVASYNSTSRNINRRANNKCEISCWPSFGDWKIERWRKIVRQMDQGSLSSNITPECRDSNLRAS